MDIDPPVTEVTKDESHSSPELDAAAGASSVDQVEEVVSEEKSQTGPTTASPCPPSPPSEKDSTTMGDEEVTGSQQTSHGSDPQEIGPEGSDATIEEILTKDDEEQEDEIIEMDSPPGETEEEQKETKNKPLTEKNIVVKPTRVVVRRLPPKINTKDFVTSVSPLPKYNYVQIDNPDPEWGQGARSVAHINFLDPEDALWFIDRFTGYQFFDEEGEAYISVCDFAMSQKIFKTSSSSKRNPLRGKLKESEEYLTFLKNYEENPFQFVFGTRPQEIVTAEVMLSEIEGRTKHIGPEATPLTQFILNNKSRREDDRKMRREKDRERQRLEKARQLEKREKERVERAAAAGKNKDKENSKERDNKNMERSNREKYRDLDREHKKVQERKRERRDKERKERREQEKVEKEATAKGMTVTYSKTGKATRWSANSSPFAKKGDSASTDKEDPNKEKESATSSGQEKPISQDLSKPAFKELKQDKSKPSPREETTKRFSNPFVKHEAKKIEIPKEDKSKFGKPFPIKNQTTTTASSPSPPKESEKDNPKPTNISKPLEKKDSTGSGDTTENGGKTTEGQDGKGKKIIVKKIVRVRKVKTTKTGEDGEPIVETRVISRKPVPQTSSSTSASSSSVKRVESNNKNEPPTAPTTEAVKEKSKEGGGESCSSSSKTTTKDEGDRRRRARPEMQFYRPGSLRSAKDKNKAKDSETKVEK